MKQFAPLARAALLGVLASTALTGCSGGGGDGGGGRMFVLSCSLGCNNGSGGQDVNCGIVNTFVNQDIAIQFSEPVDINWVQANQTAFRVINDTTAATPPGRFLLDPADKKRLIWRPALSFSATGAPSFSFEDNVTYQIQINGTSTGGAGPFVQSVNGKRNESRVLCTITTSEGITDPVPGPPSVQVFVDEIQAGSGLIATKEISTVTGQVSQASQITLVFDDIMNVGTVVTPSQLTAPFITVNIDPDGNLSDPSDQVPALGTWSFFVDDDLLTTTAVFTPTGGLPSGGAGQVKVVLDIPGQVVDLAGNPVTNGGLKAFTPEILNFGTITIPTGGEQFADQSALDVLRSSADWGESIAGSLLPGVGGGSGRLGDLVVGAGEVVTLNTSPAHAEARVRFVAGIVSGGSTLVLGDPLTPTTFSYKNNPDPLIPYEIKRFNTFTSQALAETVTHLNNFVAPDPVNFPEDLIIEQATYSIDGDDLVITWDSAGTAGNGVFAVDTNLSSGAHYDFPNSTPVTAGGVDSISFGGPGQSGEGELLTNFDFQANPAGTPPAYTIDDGIFEFSRVLIGNNGSVVFAGDNPGRLFARGVFDLESQGVISAAGVSNGAHQSNAPFGQRGADAGPGAGRGGNGADRPDNTGGDLLTLTPTSDAGIEFSGSTGTAGRLGRGVGDTGTVGAGRGGTQWPLAFPGQTFTPGGLEMNMNCTTDQVGGPGSGGAYATDGGLGVPVAVTPSALPDLIGNIGPSNTPADTAAGDATAVGLPAPGLANLGARDLNPDNGSLRGGSGGGGGGGSVEGTVTMPNSGGNMPPAEKADCVTLPATNPSPTAIVVYRSNSGGGGGGGGGAVQVQAGREAIVGGVIDSSGGDGGSSDSAGAVFEQRATPGGGGSGGAILLQSRFVNMAPVPNRLQVNGGLGGTLFDNTLAMTLSTGGDGGIGLVRAESVISNASFFDEIASAVNPFNGGINQLDPSNPLAAINWLSVDTWDAETSLPGAFTAGQSCWYKPAGNLLSLTFQDDSAGFGWDMDLVLDVGGGPQLEAYRSSGFYSGNSPQEHWGELFAENGAAGAPLVVRFQGAKSQSAITDPCNIDPGAAGSPILSGSITEWVRHPEELNAFNPKPDMIRFVILFDATDPEFGAIQGVSNLRILADPN